MSTQVLARKWRPKTFTEVVGQEHVVRALTHALSTQRLHHAYLFTGTRGVGKTTLSRLLAKALNCVGPDGTGDITAAPCGVCHACVAIDAGRFIDYIEMDAASNRGVDEMAQLLEQAVYAPSGARFKVYMIDEVHMLTGHAFNAMLKTLEEPPEHLKFILATTDPQKIPVTVLSRCLQFNLKQMPTQQIVSHLCEILKAEQISFETAALPRLARSASGSMRDALSLTDQAIAYSGGDLTDQAVQAMLGSLDETYIVRLLEALCERRGEELLAVADEIAMRSLSLSQALSDLALALQRIALIQAVPGARSDDWPGVAALEALAVRFAPEEVQLDYDIAVRGRAEMPLAPDEYAGFTMTLMRMLAFVQDDGALLRTGSGGAASSKSAGRAALATAAQSLNPKTSLPLRSVAKSEPIVQPVELAIQPAQVLATPNLQASPEAPHQRLPATTGALPTPAAMPVSAAPPAAPPASSSMLSSAAGAIVFDGDWLRLVSQVRATGLAKQLLDQAELVHFEGNRFDLRVGIKHLADKNTVDRLKQALCQYFDQPVQLSVEVGTVAGTTRAVQDRSERDARQARAVAAIEADPFVRTLVSEFDAVVVPGSIRPLS
jgi:DNA polymerase-3 subunit gamma/tau